MIRPLLAALFTFCVCLAFGQENTAPTIKVTLPKQAKPGAKVMGTLEITFSEGLHGYQNPPTDEFQIPVKVSIDTKGFVLAKAIYPKGVLKTMGGDTKPAAVYEGMIRIPVVVTMPAKPGTADLKFTVKYQQCNEQSCYPPDSISSSVKILVKK
jgi:DsbC/DsbD-like thiol-disulfide interchange protein